MRLNSNLRTGLILNIHIRHYATLYSEAVKVSLSAFAAGGIRMGQRQVCNRHRTFLAPKP